MSVLYSVTYTVLFQHLMCICHLGSHSDVQAVQTMSLRHSPTRRNTNGKSMEVSANDSRPVKVGSQQKWFATAARMAIVPWSSAADTS